MNNGVLEVRTFWCSDCDSGMQRPFPQGSFFVSVAHSCLAGEHGWNVTEESPS